LGRRADRTLLPLGYREEGRQRSIYLGRSEKLAEGVRRLLGDLQHENRWQRTLRRWYRLGRADLRVQKALWQKELVPYGLYLKGFEVRGWRNWKIRDALTKSKTQDLRPKTFLPFLHALHPTDHRPGLAAGRGLEGDPELVRHADAAELPHNAAVHRPGRLDHIQPREHLLPLQRNVKKPRSPTASPPTRRSATARCRSGRGGFHPFVPGLEHQHGAISGAASKEAAVRRPLPAIVNAIARRASTPRG